jgi:riboflavin kinase/FMN adenylyltransferase
MKVTRLPDVEPGGSGRHVAIGTFDGVHVGHREVIKGADTVLTFDPHPMSVLRPEATPALIDTFGVKRDVIASLGVAELVVIPFDRDFSSLEAEGFIDDVLVKRLGAEHVSVGENFRFGKRARGTPELLAASDAFETRVSPILEVGGEPVSSSRIRALVAEGEVAPAARLLARPFTFEGEVMEGEQRGRTLGIPTANLVPDERYVCPANGIYAALVGERPAAVNVGMRPMFDSSLGLLIEAHLIDFTGDLYGQVLRVEFLERLRGERRFADVDALVEQMGRDVDQAREIAQRAATVSRR